MLQQIQSHFVNRAFDVTSATPWLLAVGFLCVVLITFFVVKLIRDRNRRYAPLDRVTDAGQVRAILRDSFEQRRPFEIQVAAENFTRRPTIRCSPDAIGTDTISLELTGIQSLSDNWLGRVVSVYFRTKIKGQFIYYTFPSSIKGIYIPKQGLCVISLEFPQYLDNRQKRSFLRISPPVEYLLGAALWPETSMPEPEKLGNLALWPRPKLLILPGTAEQFTIMDISAGGARLHIPYSAISEHGLEFSTVSQVMFMLDLQDTQQGKQLRLWLLCRIQSVWQEGASKNIQIGLQFLSWARPRAAADQTLQGSALEWLRLSSSNEVEPLGNWIMRRHLELFRELPDILPKD